mgnify:CR=1 FL=1
MPGDGSEWMAYSSLGVLDRLAALWAADASAARCRSCMATLLCPSPESADEETLQDGVMAGFPCRLMQVRIAPHGRTDAPVLYRADVSCALPRRDRVCCERIRLWLHPDARGALRNCLDGIGASDLPRIGVFPTRGSLPMAIWLGASLDRVILDSSALDATVLREFLDGRRVAGLSMPGDIAWARTAVWRDALGRIPEDLFQSAYFDRVQIRHGAGFGAGDARLLAAWFRVHGVPAGQIVLEPEGTADTGILACRLEMATGGARIELDWVPSGSGNPCGVTVHMLDAGGVRRTFRATGMGQDAEYWIAEIRRNRRQSDQEAVLLAIGGPGRHS